MFRKTLIALSISLSIVTASHSSGIPVVDIASIAKTVEEGLTRAQEAAQQYKQLKQDYEQSLKYAEDQKKRLEGFTKFDSGFDTASSYMKNQLNDLTDIKNYDVDSELDKFGLNSSDSIKARLEGAAAKVKFFDSYNLELKDRASKLESLQSKYNQATTPQQKADLTNQLQTEQINMQYFMKQNELAEKQMEQQDKLKQEQLRKQWMEQHSYKGKN
ncbi:plasmid conjugal transfer protein [Buttiauxella sp. B2]|uniref:type IV secretion system protein n=1 Tax=Buttiauxella sp. B2 TaxID=2587812 RepID=UPI00111FA134|nr:type IV secretion system protein [Buttiauxella sp. B2]TNV16106.1 plasmid conjugal transfer protein [Buttiauxella sp. B2]